MSDLLAGYLDVGSTWSLTGDLHDSFASHLDPSGWRAQESDRCAFTQGPQGQGGPIGLCGPMLTALALALALALAAVMGGFV